MKILVTGGAGYIGSHTIIEILENTSWEVLSVDNFARSTIKTFDRIERVTGKKVKNYNVDLCDLEKTRNIPGVISDGSFPCFYFPFHLHSMRILFSRYLVYLYFL